MGQKLLRQILTTTLNVPAFCTVPLQEGSGNEVSSTRITLRTHLLLRFVFFSGDRTDHIEECQNTPAGKDTSTLCFGSARARNDLHACRRNSFKDEVRGRFQDIDCTATNH